MAYWGGGGLNRLSRTPKEGPTLRAEVIIAERGNLQGGMVINFLAR